MGIKVLLVYPNFRGMNMLPPAVGLLSAILKREGHTVRLFDTTHYESLDEEGTIAPDSDGSKSDRLMARPYKMPNEITLKTSNVFTDFRNEVESFGPDLIGISCTEDMVHLGVDLLKRIRHHKILTIMGGVFPTFAPDLAIQFPEVDIVCKGEGEDALRILCERLTRGQGYDDIQNLWIKKPDGSIKKNQIGTVDMDANPLIDMSIFEEARFYRPMGGKVYRMFPVETFRGCPYTCTYCNSPWQSDMYQKEAGQKYLRRKSFENMRRELLYYKDVMKAEYLYFWADTFFSWNSKEFDEFAEIYQDIKLPFWCQTRAETITFEKFKKLKDIGVARISFGLEHGNEEFRKRMLQRRVSNDLMIKNFKILNDLGIPYSVNNIMGFPTETYELAFDTIALNRQIDATDRNAYPFTPFHGTPLRKVCEDQGLLKHEDIVRSVIVNGSLLDMPQFPQKQVNGLVRTFNMYVKFPESRWPEIKRAEEDTPEGNRIYEALRGEFMDRFWSKESEDFESAALEKQGAPMA